MPKKDPALRRGRRKRQYKIWRVAALVARYVSAYMMVAVEGAKNNMVTPMVEKQKAMWRSDSGSKTATT